MSIAVKETDINIGKIIKEDIRNPEELVAAILVIEDQIGALKHYDEHLKEVLRTTKYEDILDSLASRALIGDKEEKVVIDVTTKLGEKIGATLYEDVDSCFVVAKDLSDKAVLDTVVPDKYKKISVLLDKKKIEEDFEKGTLPDTLKIYCSKSPMKITKIRKTIAKKKGATK